MTTKVTIREGRDIRELFESGRGTWAGKGAAALGLTGEVRPEDFERLPELVTDEDEDQDGDDVRPYATKPAGGLSLIEQMRQDGTL
jgi:hypothetical protein